MVQALGVPMAAQTLLAEPLRGAGELSRLAKPDLSLYAPDHKQNWQDET
jgi:hypothetical protein